MWQPTVKAIATMPVKKTLHSRECGVVRASFASFQLGHDRGPVLHPAVAEGVGFDGVSFAALLALDEHRGVIRVGDVQRSAARAADAVGRIYVNHGTSPWESKD